MLTQMSAEGQESIQNDGPRKEGGSGSSHSTLLLASVSNYSSLYHEVALAKQSQQVSSIVAEQ